MIATVDFVPGDIVRVHQKIKEGEKSRIQIFQGTVLQVRGRGDSKTFTVKKDVGGVAVEKIWQIGSPAIEKVEIKEHSKYRIRRSKLTYLHKEKIRP